MAPIPSTQRVFSWKNAPMEIATFSSSSSDGEDSTILQTTPLQNGGVDLDRIGPNIPLLKPTIHHLRQAIRAQADIEVPLLRSSGSAIPIYELADVITLKRAVDDIKAALDDVLGLEFKEGRTLNRDSSTSDASQDDQDDSGDDGDLGGEDENHHRATVQPRVSNADRHGVTSGDSLFENMSEGETQDTNDSDDGMDSPIEGIMTWNANDLPDDHHPINAASSNNNPSDDDSPPNRQTPLTQPPLTPPTSSQESFTTTSPRPKSVLSRLNPSRLLNLFLPTPSPSPSPANAQQQRSTPVSSPLISPLPHQAQDPKRIPSETPDLDLPSSSSAIEGQSPPQRSENPSLTEGPSEDELSSPLPTHVHTPNITRPFTPSGKPPLSLPLAPRRSPRTHRPRSSTRLAAMIPPNVRTAGSMGPCKTLPGPRVRVTNNGDRGRSMVRISAVAVAHKRSGSAGSSVGSSDAGGGGGGGGGRGGGGKRVRFEGLGTR